MNYYVKLESGKKSASMNREAFQRLVGKLFYLNHIAYVLKSLSEFMNDPREIHSKQHIECWPI